MAAATERVPIADTAGALGVALAELQLMHRGSTLTHVDDEDVEAPCGEGDYLDDVLERCTALGLLSERAYDQLTDALASGERSEEDALAEWALRLRQWEENSIGVVLDLHYLQITASSFSLQTDWSLPDFEQALVAACGGGTIVQRFACDAALDEHGEQHNHGKAALHARLRRAGYELVLSPGKGVTKSGQRGQGATDVDVAVCIFDVAGAFAQAPRARTLALVAGDSDFKPALVRVLAEHGSAATAAARGEGAGGAGAGAGALRACVVADRTYMSARYLEWIDASCPDVELVPLERLLQVIAPSILNLRGAARPRDEATGRADARAVAAACEGAATACTGTELLTLNVSGETARGAPAAPPWGDPETRELVVGLLARPAVGSRLGELWVHHTDIGDESCVALGSLLRVACSLNELHISDSEVTLRGLRALGKAAVTAGCGEGGRKRLYVNARHLGGEEALAIAHEFQGAAIFRLQARFGGLAPRSPAAGRGGGKGKGSGGGERGKAKGRGGGGSPYNGGKGKGSSGSGKGSPGKGGKGKGGRR